MIGHIFGSRRNVNGQVNEHDEVVHEPEPVEGDEQESRRTAEASYVDGRQSRVSMATMRARRRLASWASRSTTAPVS